MGKKLAAIGGALALLGVGSASGGYLWLKSNLGRSPIKEPRYVHLDGTTGRRVMLNRLQKEGIITSSDALEIYARWKKAPPTVPAGVYLFKPGMFPYQILDTMRGPLKQMVRIPEGRWIAWVGEILEGKGVCTKDDYVALASKPDDFRGKFPWLPPAIPTLEGYLYPDTYDLPPTIGARTVVEQQLRAFEKRVKPKDLAPEDLKRAVTIGSMVELEAARDAERPMVAGVIENRITKNMRLELDATVLYGMQKWKVLGPGQVRKVESPYNTYLHAGLPPGPIGSPGLASIRAAMNPDSHPYFFYVAKGDGSGEHLFAKSYADHVKNIRAARAMRPQPQ